MAKKFREELEHDVAFCQADAEQSFYGALADNPSAQELIRVTIARELSQMLMRDLAIDCKLQEKVSVKLRLKIKMLLKR